MAVKLTKRTVDAAQPGAVDLYLFDSDLTGFGLKITPAGRKVYVVQYRTQGNKRRLTIGTHGSPWTPDQARQEAVRLLGLVAAGQDPAESKAADRHALTMAELVALFLEEHTEIKNRPRTVAEYKRLLEKHVVPAMGRVKVESVTRERVARVHHAMRGTPYQANRVLAVLSKLFGWAEMRGHRQEHSNPCRLIEKYPEVKRERFLSDEEISRLGAALKAGEESGRLTPYMAAAVRLLILTGARLSEILTLQWEWVDMERACLRLPPGTLGTKGATREKVIHLSAPALEILTTLPREEGHPFVIAGQVAGEHLVNIHKPWGAIREEAGLPGLRLHDLRHSFASMGAGAGLGLPVIGALLGHTQAQTTARYAHVASDPMRRANDLISGRIAAALDGGPAKGEVIPMKQRSRG